MDLQKHREKKKRPELGCRVCSQRRPFRALLLWLATLWLAVLPVDLVRAEPTPFARQGRILVNVPERHGQWYAVNQQGTYLVSGQRIVFFEGLDVPEEMAGRLADLLRGALWREGFLLTHEFILRSLWPQLPVPVRALLRAGSQGWLLWTLYRSLHDVFSPLQTLINDYRKVWTEPYFQGPVPIAINDTELAFRFFLQAVFPEQSSDPVSIQIDRVPEIPGLKDYENPAAYTQPWVKLHSAMVSHDIQRLGVTGNAEGELAIRYRTGGSGSPEQVITASVSSQYQPVPWLLDMIRQKQSREDIRLYASLLSSDVIDLVARALACSQQNTVSPLNPEQRFCLAGSLTMTEDGMHYEPDIAAAPQLIWDERSYEGGRVLPLSGCNVIEKAMCWENYMVWGDSSQAYPWPQLTFYSRYASYQERNNWLLFQYEPQVWYTGGYMQVRVPEWIGRSLLAVLSSVGQALVNRTVTTLHDRWWQNPEALLGNKPVKTSYPASESAPNENLHAPDRGGYCNACEAKECRYPLCIAGLCGRYQPETMVDLGCSTGVEKHLLCSQCFFGILENSRQSVCTECNQYHRMNINRDVYQMEQKEQLIPLAPKCPLCGLTGRFDYRLGNVAKYLGDECGNLYTNLLWFLGDGLSVPKAVVEAEEGAEP